MIIDQVVTVQEIEDRIRRQLKWGSHNLLDYERGKLIINEYDLTGEEYTDAVIHLAWWVGV